MLNWYVWKATPRYEIITAAYVKKAFARFGQEEAEVYVPLLKRRQVRYGKPEFTSSALFTGYGFVRCENYHPVSYETKANYRLQGLVKFTYDSDPIIVPTDIIEEIKNREAVDGYVYLNGDTPDFSCPYIPGDEVCVRFRRAELDAIFARHITGTDRAIILFSMFGRQMEKEVALTDLSMRMDAA